MKKNKSNFDEDTGEVLEPQGKLNEVIIVTTVRPDGSLRIQQDFSNCPTMAEQHTAHETDINWLMKKYKPDELAAYISARNQYRREILGHDFSQEPSLQDAKNIVVQSRENFEALPEKIRKQFPNHLEFLKFIDNPSNVEKMKKLGLLTQKQLDLIKIPDDVYIPPTMTTTKNEAKEEKKAT